MSGDPSAPGLLASLRRVLAQATELAQVRLELLGTDLEREKLRIVDALMRAALALVLLAIGVVMLAAFVVVLWWDEHRLLALGAMTVLFIGGGAWLWRAALARLQSPSGLFAATTEELAKDRAALDRESPP